MKWEDNFRRYVSKDGEQNWMSLAADKESWNARTICDNVNRELRAAKEALYGRTRLVIIDEVGKMDEYQLSDGIEAFKNVSLAVSADGM